MMRTSAAGCLCVWMALASAASSQEEHAVQEASQTQPAYETIVYPVRNASPQDLIKALTEFFKGTETRVTPEPTGNLLLMRIRSADRKEILRLLDQLDRPPRTFRIQVQLLKCRGEALSKKETESLSGLSDDVQTRIQELASKGRVFVARRMELTAVENRHTRLSVGGFGWVVMDVAGPWPGRRVSYRQTPIGAIISLVAKASTDGVITVQTKFEHSEIQPTKDANRGEGQPVLTSTAILVHESTLQIRDGHCLFLAGQVDHSAGKSQQAYLVVGARLLKPSEGKEASFQAVSQHEPTLPGRSSSDRVARYVDSYLQRRDRNNSGALERDEWTEVRNADQIDANGDGKLTRDELLRHFGRR